MRPVVAGTRHCQEYVPGDADTASAIGNTGVDLVSTPALIGFLEHTCHLLIAPYYEEGEATVGSHVNVDHLAATAVGRPVTVSAELIGQEGRRLEFAAEINQDGKLVMCGRHRRHLIELERITVKPSSASMSPERSRGPATLDFWFDFNSPWCYLAASRIGDMARCYGAHLAWRPVHLSNLLDRIDGRRPLERNPAFVAWYRQDLRDWAEIQGMELRYHPRHPLRPSRALRAALYAGESGLAEPFVLAVMRALWVEGADISEVAVLAEIASDVGLDARDIAEVIAGPAYKARLEANLSEAVDAGVFGLPSVVLGGKIFFGNDRLALLDRALSRR